MPRARGKRRGEKRRDRNKTLPRGYLRILECHVEIPSAIWPLFIIASMANRSSNYRRHGSLIDALLRQLPGPVICLPRLRGTLTFNHGCKGLITSLLTAAANASKRRVFVTPADQFLATHLRKYFNWTRFPLANNTYRFTTESPLARLVIFPSSVL